VFGWWVPYKSVLPVQHVPRRVPVAMKECLKQKLSELTKQGIITKVEEPTSWISNMVAIMKPGKLRLCIDPRDLNNAIKWPKYQMPTLEEILPTASNAKILRMAFTRWSWMMPVLTWPLFGLHLVAISICTCHLVYRQLQKNFKGECTQCYNGFTEWKLLLMIS